MKNEVYLIDSNSFIEPYRRYYQFSFASTFWRFLQNCIKTGNVAVLDLVYDEIGTGNDSLAEWINSFDLSVIDHREKNIITNYSIVLNHISKNPCYSSAAFDAWANAPVADPWLIATAMTDSKYIIVTFEVPNKNLTETQKTKKVKIPDVAAAMNVQCINLFDLIKKLDFKF